MAGPEHPVILCLLLFLTRGDCILDLDLHVSADDSFKLYADGVLKAHHHVWNQLFTINVPGNSRVLAIEAKNEVGYCAIYVSSDRSSERIWSSTRMCGWRCTEEQVVGDWAAPGYVDSHWPVQGQRSLTGTGPHTATGSGPPCAGPSRPSTAEVVSARRTSSRL